MKLGAHHLANRLFVAPMAGVTDRPFRQLCKRMGAGYAVSEMAASNPALWASEKSARRLNHQGETEPRAVQLAGGDPGMMAQATRFNIERGAQVIDINMGCPARKVCNVQAGSALMSTPDLALRIIDAVVQSARSVDPDVPVTLKMRTGPGVESGNAVALAQAAERAGVAMVTIHGRSRACGYKGKVDYSAIAAVKRSVRIPVVANGDIDSGEKADQVLRETGADAVMIGRAAQGRPWIFQQISHYFSQGTEGPPPSIAALRSILAEHLEDHYSFHGSFLGVLTARKHVRWYLEGLRTSHGIADPSAFLASFFALQQPEEQLQHLDHWLAQQSATISTHSSLPLA